MKKILTLFIATAILVACTKNSNIPRELESPTLVCSDCGGIDPGEGDGGSDDGKPKYAQQGCIIDSSQWGTKCISSPGTVCTKTSSCTPITRVINTSYKISKDEVHQIAKEHADKLYKAGVINKSGINETIQLVTKILQENE